MKEEEKQRQDELEKQRQDELEEQRQDEDILLDIANKLRRNANKMTENINSEPPINFRTTASRKDPFDDINKNKEKLTPSPSKIPAPISKLREPQGLATGEQASIEIMKNELKTSKDIIEYFKKELDNREYLSQRYLRIDGKIIQEEDKVRKLEKKIRERKEDIERRYGIKI